jgi:hypothetical protein
LYPFPTAKGCYANKDILFVSFDYSLNMSRSSQMIQKLTLKDPFQQNKTNKCYLAAKSAFSCTLWLKGKDHRDWCVKANKNDWWIMTKHHLGVGWEHIYEASTSYTIWENSYALQCRHKIVNEQLWVVRLNAYTFNNYVNMFIFSNCLILVLFIEDAHVGIKNQWFVSYNGNISS